MHIWPEVSRYFGNIGRSMLTCFQLITLDNWYMISREVSPSMQVSELGGLVQVAERSWLANLLIILVVYMFCYGMLKVLVGVVVERVMAVSADSEKERGRVM